MKGLRLLNVSNQKSEWTVLSATSEVYRHAFNYYYDAFVVLEFDLKSQRWTITLHNHDIRLPHEHFHTKSFDFFTGQELPSEEN
jgi:hypothetical protein